MYYKEITEDIYAEVNIIINRMIKDTLINRLAHKVINATKERYIKKELYGIGGYPARLAKQKDKETYAISCRIGALWAIYNEYIHIVDAIQDKDEESYYFQLLNIPQALNLAFIFALNLPGQITALPLTDEIKAKLTDSFTQCALKMFTGQFYDIHYTNFIDEKIDIMNILDKKSGAAYQTGMSLLYEALGKENPAAGEWSVRYGTLRCLLSDYLDIWLRDYSEDLQELKASLPLICAWNDPKYKDQIRMLLAGRNTAPAKQLTLRRWLSRTAAVEEFEKACREFKQLPFPPELNENEDIKKEVEDFNTQCTELIASLKELRTFCADDKDFTFTAWRFITRADEWIKNHHKELIPNHLALLYLNKQGEDITPLLKELNLDVPGEETDNQDPFFREMAFYLILKKKDFPRMNFWLTAYRNRLSRLNTGTIALVTEALILAEQSPELIENGKTILSSFQMKELNLYSTGRSASLEELFLTCRFQQKYGTAPVNPPWKNELIKFQRMNGSWWNSSLESAFALKILTLMEGTDPLILRRGARYLQETQTPAGCWESGDWKETIICTLALLKTSSFFDG